MGAFEVVLEVIRGATSTGGRMTTTVLSQDRLSAAITAEENVDQLLPDPKTMYSHALSVTPLGHAVASVGTPVAA